MPEPINVPAIRASRLNRQQAAANQLGINLLNVQQQRAQREQASKQLGIQQQQVNIQQQQEDRAQLEQVFNQKMESAKQALSLLNTIGSSITDPIQRAQLLSPVIDAAKFAYPKNEAIQGLDITTIAENFEEAQKLEKRVDKVLTSSASPGDIRTAIEPMIEEFGGLGAQREPVLKRVGELEKIGVQQATADAKKAAGIKPPKDLEELLARGLLKKNSSVEDIWDALKKVQGVDPSVISAGVTAESRERVADTAGQAKIKAAEIAAGARTSSANIRADAVKESTRIRSRAGTSQVLADPRNLRIKVENSVLEWAIQKGLQPDDPDVLSYKQDLLEEMRLVPTPVTVRGAGQPPAPNTVDLNEDTFWERK
jgi:hypothetical protein